MPFFDLSLEKLYEYYPQRNEPADFDAFWQTTLAETRQRPLEVSFSPLETGLKLIDSYDVRFSGFGGQPIRGWLNLPAGQQNAPLACVVEFIGYGGGRDLAINWLFWAAAGYAHFIMDTRGQGSSWSRGDTPDSEPEGDPHYPGFMTRGIQNPKSYYYRRVFSDAVRAVEAARAHPAVDKNRVAITGGSQGGGITLATAGLTEVQAVLPDVPFLCHYRHATQLVASYPYAEISNYCKVHRDKVETVFETLSYFDGLNFAARAKAPALFSAGLMDDICPPSTVFAAYNHYAGPKQIKTYEYNNHEGGANFQTLEKLNFLQQLWGK